MTNDELKAKLRYYISELKILLNQIASGYQPNPKIAEFIDFVIDWLTKFFGSGVI